MFFIFPMWDNQSQRIGMQRCTPLGYTLQGIARLLGTIGLFLLFGMIIFFIKAGGFSNFDSSNLWLFSIPFTFGVIAQILFLYGWSLASKKGFDYDYETREASWEEDGKQITYKWESGQNQ